VTELEILHGVLRNPQMAGHAYFYFRDPVYVGSIPEKERKDFSAEHAMDAEKLTLGVAMPALVVNHWPSRQMPLATPDSAATSRPRTMT